jgi:hypothetical protein
MKDRVLQMLLKLVMEPYLEPLGDKHSFGYRPGRNCHQATAYLHDVLSHRQNQETAFSNRRLFWSSLYSRSKVYQIKKFSLETLDKTQINEQDQKKIRLIKGKFRYFNKVLRKRSLSKFPVKHI